MPKHSRNYSGNFSIETIYEIDVVALLSLCFSEKGLVIKRSTNSMFYTAARTHYVVVINKVWKQNNISFNVY